MNARLPERRFLVGLMLVGTLVSTQGQFLYQQAPEEEQLFKCRINSGSVGVYTEGAYEWSQYSGSTPVKNSDHAERSRGATQAFRSRVIVAADGNSSRLSVAMGLRKRDDRPLGVAVRTYYTSPRHDDDYLESWLDLWDGDRLLPGYGWIFGMGDGTSNVGLGLLNTSAAFGNTDYRALLKRWLRSMPEEWGYVEENRTEPVRGAALPMGFNRTPHYHRGLLLAGDAAGLVNPFNGEGIAYAMESGEILARTIAQALARPTREQAERVLHGYPQALRDAYGGYYALGRVFVQLIGRPQLMRFVTRHGMSRPALMRFALKLLANLTDPRGGDAADRLINGMTRLAPNPR